MYELDRIARAIENIETKWENVSTRLVLIEEQLGSYRRRETMLAKILAGTIATYVLYRVTGIFPR